MKNDESQVLASVLRGSLSRDAPVAFHFVTKRRL